MSRPRIVLTRRWPAAVEDVLRERYDLVANADDHPFSADELAHALATADALCPTVTDAIDAALLDRAAPRARLLGNFGVGFNHIDVEAARRAGLVVTNTPGVLTDCTADLAVMLMLMVARRAGAGERMVRDDAWAGWAPTQLLGTRVSGKTLGLVGFGRIARAVAARAHHGFGMRVLYYNPSAVPAAVTAALNADACDSIEAVLEAADFVSLHCPGGAATHHLIDAARLARMPAHAYLINTARGDVVDQQALIDALAARRIAGAGLDVYAGEPVVPAALKTLDNVVLLPHLGSATHETRTAMGLRVVANLDAFFAGREPPDRVA
ncbi:MAG: D-glycerate dehydrogenase [Gammaproteobacteria bacterium]|nr:D-glycerate dehydrogenase [Gammaproteobacteria bacterium]